MPDSFGNDSAMTSPEPLPEETVQAPPVTRQKKKVESSKTGYTWVGLVVGALLGILILVFILQNLNSVRVDLLFWSFSMPLGVGVLLATIGGALVMALVGGVRIIQLRRQAKRP